MDIQVEIKKDASFI